MAEAFLKSLAGDKIETESAGLEPGSLNPLVVEVMREVGIDISANKTKGVMDMIERGKTYDYVVTVCDESSAESCPTFSGNSKKIHWSLNIQKIALSVPFFHEGGINMQGQLSQRNDSIKIKIMRHM